MIPQKFCFELSIEGSTLIIRQDGLFSDKILIRSIDLKVGYFFRYKHIVCGCIRLINEKYSINTLILENNNDEVSLMSKSVDLLSIKNQNTINDIYMSEKIELNQYLKIVELYFSSAINTFTK